MRYITIPTILLVLFMLFLGVIFYPLSQGELPIKFGLDITGGVIVEYKPDLSKRLEGFEDKTDTEILNLCKEVLIERIAQKLLTIPDVYIKGKDTIVVSIPDVKDHNQALAVVGQTYHLTLRLVEKEYDTPQKGIDLFPYNGAYLELGPVAFSGDKLDPDAIKVLAGRANVGDPELSHPRVAFGFIGKENAKLASFTKKHVGQKMAILLDDTIKIAPVIQSALTNGGVISGHYTYESAMELANFLRSGAMPVRLNLETMRSVGPSLGEEILDKGKVAALLSLVMLIFYILIAYINRIWFLASAILTLGFLIFCIIGLASVFHLTLDMAAIAGCVLAIGMGMDAFVIIFESLEVKLRRLKPDVISRQYGNIVGKIYSFKNEGRVLLHSNTTTMLSILPLILVDRLKYLALFMIIGVFASVISILFTRETLKKLHRSASMTGVPLLSWLRELNLGIFRLEKPYIAVSIIVFGLSIYLVVSSLVGKDYLAFGKEFKPGTQLIVEVNKKSDVKTLLSGIRKNFKGVEGSYHHIAESSISKQGFESNKYMLMLNKSIVTSENGSDGKTSQPKGALAFTSKNLSEFVKRADVQLLGIESVGARVSRYRMTKSWTVLILSFTAIVIYLLFFQPILDRFISQFNRNNSRSLRNENKQNDLEKRTDFGVSISVVVAVFHDISFMLVACWLFHIELSLAVISAFMLIVGYSVNDSIVLWSHIQNEAKHTEYSPADAKALVTKSIDSIFSRAILTSTTTVMPAISLLLIGIDVLYGFSILIIIGTVSGTFSSFFIVGAFAVKALAKKEIVVKIPVGDIEQDREDLEEVFT